MLTSRRTSPSLLLRKQILVATRAVPVPLGHVALAKRDRGWGEGSNQLKNRNFGSSMIAHPLPNPPPRWASPCKAASVQYARLHRFNMQGEVDSNCQQLLVAKEKFNDAVPDNVNKPFFSRQKIKQKIVNMRVIMAFRMGMEIFYIVDFFTTILYRPFPRILGGFSCRDEKQLHG